MRTTVHSPSARTLLLIAAPLLLPTLGCGERPAADAATTAAPRGVPVRTATVVARDLDETLVLTGTLKPRALVELPAEVAARLERVLRDEGARVAKGETLALLDDTDYRLASDRARAALAVADANRAHALAERERADNLLKTGGITDKDHLSAQVALQVAEASLAQARADAAISAQQYERTRVRAPFAGRIGKRHADAGAMLAAGAPLFTLVDDSVLEFEAQVASRDLAKVRLGAPVSVSVDALPGTVIPGKVARVAPLVDERTRSFKAVVEVKGRQGLVGGLFARASVAVSTAHGALVVPPSALVRDGSDPARAEVFVVRQGKAERQAIALGAEGPDGVQATSGLARGDVVVLDPPTTLASGAPVEPQDRGGPAPTATAAAAATDASPVAR
jgi:membrane fusion protein (multidrug efflux system)